MQATMEVEITRAYIEPQEKILVIDAINCDPIHLMNVERNRIDDGEEMEVRFQFNTRNKYGFLAARKFLMNQKAANGSKTYGEALNRIVGTVCEIPVRYRVRTWE